MKKLQCNTMQRLSIGGVLNGHKITDMAIWNRAMKIAERVALTLEERKTINYQEKGNGTVTWGHDDEGKPLPDFKDIEVEISLSDEMTALLKEFIDKKMKDGFSLSNPLDKAVMEVYSQLLNPASDVAE